MVIPRCLIRFCCCILAMLCIVCPASAWLAKGHEDVAGYAVALTAQDLPAFFESEVETIRHCSQDPDVFKMKDTPQLDSEEYPEHFIDLELLSGTPLPSTRYDFISLCYSRKIKPDQVGLVPYAVAEWTQRLTVAFGEFRKWPEDKSIQLKCAIYAGVLSHYAADLCQPLHTTVDYDGRANADGQSPHSGIHVKVDALIEKTQLTKQDLQGVHVTPMRDLMAGIIDELNSSHALVDALYRMESDLPGLDQPLAATGPAADFAKERLLASTRFTASLYLKAWNDSARINFPSWHHRPAWISTSRPADSATTRPAQSTKPVASIHGYTADNSFAMLATPELPKITPGPALPISGRLASDLYVQISAEYQACCCQIYHLAATQLKATLMQRQSAITNPAVVMDLDETVLANSAFEVFLYENNLEHTPNLWEEYEAHHPGDVRLVPGAKQFIKMAEALGVTVIFISNRSELHRQATADALGRLEINTAGLDDRLYLRQTNGPSGKAARWQVVRAKYNVLMFFGDNLLDFSEIFAAQKLSNNATSEDYLEAIQRRASLVDAADCHWGVDWFVVPNPMYGEWEKLIRPDPKAVLHSADIRTDAHGSPVALCGSGPTATQSDPAGQVRIHDIQGRTRISPFNGRTVSGVPGVVTGVRGFGSIKGFWFQDPHPDNDPATSEGIFVATDSAPTVNVGDSVTVDGKVVEFYPGQEEDSWVQSVTEITAPVVHVVATGQAVPAPVVLRGRYPGCVCAGGARRREH